MSTGEFLSTVQPLLEAQDLDGFARTIRQRWSVADLMDMLGCTCCDTRKVAALALGMVGPVYCTSRLTPLLASEDPMIYRMAEHALWSIWFRAGTPEANLALVQGTSAMDRKAFDCAVRHFTKAIEVDPEFAEAYNQRAIAHYLQERYAESLEDCRQVIQRIPEHFGAWAGKGHCQAHLGRISEAVTSYRKALQLNPHLDSIRQGIAELTQRPGHEPD